MQRDYEHYDNWEYDERTIQLQEELKSAREVIKLLADWRIPEEVYCETLH